MGNGRGWRVGVIGVGIPTGGSAVRGAQACKLSWFTQRGPAPSEKGNGMEGKGTAPIGGLQTSCWIARTWPAGRFLVRGPFLGQFSILIKTHAGLASMATAD